MTAPIDWFHEQPRVVQVVLAGVALAVGVSAAVVVVAVTGTFVAGVGEEVEATPPQASFAVQSTDGGPSLVHTGGTAIPAGRLSVAIDGERREWTALAEGVGPDDRVGAGTALALPDDASGAHLAVVWQRSGSEAHVIADLQVP